MRGLNLTDIAERMRDIDICMLTTLTEGGAVSSRPMSNNRQVEYDGDSYYFTWDRSRMVGDIENQPKVGLTFQDRKGFAVAVEGDATLIRDKEAFEAHWTEDLDDWFEQGVETSGLVLIKVAATRIHYWDGEDDGEVKLTANPTSLLG